MIVRRNLDLQIVLRHTWPYLLWFVLTAFVAIGLARVHGLDQVHVSMTTVGPLGTALAVFLAFRNSSAYDRWWEARKLWGSLVNQSRTFARQVVTMVGGGDDQRALVRRQIGYAHALRLALRGQRDRMEEEVGPWLASPAEAARVLRARNVPSMILQVQAEQLAAALKDDRVDPLHHVELERTLAAITDVQGGCERIKNTPFLRQYDYYPRVFVNLFTTIVPFAVVEDLGFATPLLSVPISFLFFALARLGSANEDPFDARLTDVPLTAISRTIEISLLEALGEPALPPPLEPVNGFLD